VSLPSGAGSLFPVASSYTGGRFGLSLKRAGFDGIRVITTIDADMTQAEKEQYLREIDERCPISDNIHKMTPMEFVVA